MTSDSIILGSQQVEGYFFHESDRIIHQLPTIGVVNFKKFRRLQGIKVGWMVSSEQ